MTKLQVLATDMDGTFIPLQGNDENRKDLLRLGQLLRTHAIDLMYVTGRHLEIVLEAIDSEQLPRPQWVVCDVGTSIYHRNGEADYQLVEAYADHLQRLAGQLEERFVQSLLELPSVRLQESQKQGTFKRSYYCDAEQVQQLAEEIDQRLEHEQARYHTIPSVDPFTGDGLIDLLPCEASKAYAISWWTQHVGQDQDSIVFAGDSGNDLAALTAGYHSILVGNADPSVAEEVRQQHQQHAGERLYLAQKHATSGVLEGLLYFLNR